MKTYKLEDGTEVYVLRSTYTSNGSLAVMLYDAEDNEPYAVITTNIDDSDNLHNKFFAFVDTNNCPWAKEFLIRNCLGVPMPQKGHSGFCTYPLFLFAIDEIEPLEHYA